MCQRPRLKLPKPLAEMEFIEYKLARFFSAENLQNRLKTINTFSQHLIAYEVSNQMTRQCNAQLNAEHDFISSVGFFSNNFRTFCPIFPSFAAGLLIFFHFLSILLSSAYVEHLSFRCILRNNLIGRVGLRTHKYRFSHNNSSFVGKRDSNKSHFFASYNAGSRFLTQSIEKHRLIGRKRWFFVEMAISTDWPRSVRHLLCKRSIFAVVWVFWARNNAIILNGILFFAAACRYVWVDLWAFNTDKKRRGCTCFPMDFMRMRFNSLIDSER